MAVRRLRWRHLLRRRNGVYRRLAAFGEAASAIGEGSNRQLRNA
jgi:hypothetical protein